MFHAKVKPEPSLEGLLECACKLQKKVTVQLRDQRYGGRK